MFEDSSCNLNLIRGTGWRHSKTFRGHQDDCVWEYNKKKFVLYEPQRHLLLLFIQGADREPF